MGATCALQLAFNIFELQAYSLFKSINELAAGTPRPLTPATFVKVD